MTCSSAVLTTSVFTTASRPLPKSSFFHPGVGGNAAPGTRRRPTRSLAPRASAGATSGTSAISWPDGVGSAEIGATRATASVVNLGKRGEIATGLPFLDHMIDQLTSHAQLGVSVVVTRDGVPSVPCVDASGTYEQDEAVARAAGAALGEALAQTLAPGISSPEAARTTEFAAPLDEAYAKCVLEFVPGKTSPGALRFALAPYGPGAGRARIGTYKTKLTEPFFSSLVESLGTMDVALEKKRGDNAHHIVESAFKAFSRCLRALMDGSEAAGGSRERGSTSEPSSSATGVSVRSRSRIARKSRSTKETEIDVSVDLDGDPSATSVSTGVKTLDDLLGCVAEEGAFSLSVRAKGDLWIDDHHTTEDVAITIGQVLNEALGDKAGCNRMGRAVSRVGESEVEVICDLSNRPYLCNGLVFESETVGDLSAEMIDHLFMSVATNGQMTAHIVCLNRGADERDVAEAAARAFGKCLKQCATIDPRRAGAVASSKGTLSV